MVALTEAVPATAVQTTTSQATAPLTVTMLTTGELWKSALTTALETGMMPSPSEPMTCMTTPSV